MNFFDNKKESTKSNNSNESNYSEEEMDLYNLDEIQKEDIKNGKYDPWDFEEDEVDEDSYYFEDDE